MLEKRSFTLAGHRTSVALEPAFWAALTRLADAGGEPLVRLLARVDAQRQPGEKLASVLRVTALQTAAH